MRLEARQTTFLCVFAVLFTTLNVLEKWAHSAQRIEHCANFHFSRLALTCRCTNHLDLGLSGEHIWIRNIEDKLSMKSS